MRHNLPNNWKKSSYSGDNAGGNCLETQTAEGAVAVRDSKNPDMGAFMFTPAAWTSFVDATKAGEFGE